MSRPNSVKELVQAERNRGMSELKFLAPVGNETREPDCAISAHLDPSNGVLQ